MSRYFTNIGNAQSSLQPAVDASQLKNYNYSLGIYRINDPKAMVMVGVTAQMHVVFNLLNRYAATEDNVLILGETGTGKELAAMTLHYNGPRVTRSINNFVPINCSSIPPTLIESELFGYERGAYTDANRSGRGGAFLRAKDGTIVLDEIGDMPFDLQARLLRVVEEKKIKKIGSDDYLSLGNIKIVTSTNKDLASLVREGKFRHDLFHRLSTLQLYMPSLKERGRNEVRALFRYYVTGDARSTDESLDGALETLMELNLPGNVRSLANLTRQARILGNGQVTSQSLIQAVPYVRGQEAVTPFTDGNRPTILNLDEFERWAIEEALAQTNGMQVEAAKLLGLTPRALNYRLKVRGMLNRDQRQSKSDVHSTDEGLNETD